VSSRSGPGHWLRSAAVLTSARRGSCSIKAVRYCVTPVKLKYHFIGVHTLLRCELGSHKVLARLFWLALLLFPLPGLADTVLIYSSVNNLYGVNLTSNKETFLTSASLSATVNALAVNSTDGLVYYGDQTSVYYWDPALGTGPSAHVLINNFENGFIRAPVHNLNSTGGSYLDGKYYIGSETDNGFIEDLYELTMSADGRQLVAARALDIHAACQCSEVQLGGFGDIAVIDSAGGPVIYGSSADLTGNDQGTHAGIWRFELLSNTFTLLADGVGGQMANTLGADIYSNVGNRIQQLNLDTGQLSNETLFATGNAIWDFTGGFSFDFGDAPDSYGGAVHLVEGSGSSSVHIGLTPPDNEVYTQHAGTGGNDGLGDDQNGIDDEDAVAVIPNIKVDDSDYTLTAACNRGNLAAWIDFNQNGTFDFNERNSNHPVQCTAGAAIFRWTGFQVPFDGVSYLRIRTANDADEVFRPTGFATSGEVEDHRINFTDDSVGVGGCPAGNLSHIYKSVDVPKFYSGNQNNPTVSTINVPDSLIITDVNVLNFDAEHRWQDRLYFVLERNRDFVFLYGNSCGQNNSFNLNFDDEANRGVGCLPSVGETARPQRSLSAYDGSDARGEWQMQVYNYTNDNRGIINSWALEICALDPGGTEANIVLGKVAEVAGRNVAITLAVHNNGEQELKNVELNDELDEVFGVGNYSVVSPPAIISSPPGFSANLQYTGQPGATSVLIADAALLPGQEVRVQFTVAVGFNSSDNVSLFMNQARVSAVSETSEKLVDLSNTGFDFSIDLDNPTIITLDDVLEISGVVFEDTSVSEQTAHDGVQQAGELGVSGRPVSVIDSASGDVLATAVTAADGSWTALIGSEYVDQLVDVVVTEVSRTQFISELPLDNNASNTDGIVSLLVQAESENNVAYVGLIDKSSLILSQSNNVIAGESVLYHHTFSAPTYGSVSFNLDATQSGQGINWVQTLYHDQNCNQQVDGVDYQITNIVDVRYSETVCLTIEVKTPANGKAGESQSLELTSYMLPADASASNHNVSFTNSVIDVTTLVSNEVGNLVLDKSVVNVTLGGQQLTQNSAKPGDVLEYTIAYRNTGSGGINDLLVTDEAPAYTQIEPGSIECAQTPASIACSPSVSGAQINWQFQGSLPPGQSGTVSYQVKIE